MIDSPAGMTDLVGDMLNVAYIFIACGVWSVVIGAMIITYYMDDISEEDYESLGNEQWQRDQDELEEN
jgi:hypothetical protein